MVPINAKLKGLEEKISETVAYIEALKARVQRAEIKMRRLRQKEAALLESCKDQRRVLSTIRNLPEDVLREICVAYVNSDTPSLIHPNIPLPYRLAQISSGMRHITLTTPSLWKCMDIAVPFGSHIVTEAMYSILAHKAHEWFGRAGALPLTLFIRDTNPLGAHWARR